MKVSVKKQALSKDQMKELESLRVLYQQAKTELETCARLHQNQGCRPLDGDEIRGPCQEHNLRIKTFKKIEHLNLEMNKRTEEVRLIYEDKMRRQLETHLKELTELKQEKDQLQAHLKVIEHAAQQPLLGEIDTLKAKIARLSDDQSAKKLVESLSKRVEEQQELIREHEETILKLTQRLNGEQSELKNKYELTKQKKKELKLELKSTKERLVRLEEAHSDR